MKYCVGLDIAMKETAICVVDDQRRILREGFPAYGLYVSVASLTGPGQAGGRREPVLRLDVRARA